MLHYQLENTNYYKKNKMTFKYTEDELQKVAIEMYKLMTKGSTSVIDYWPAFKMAQSKVNPKNSYSINFQNPKLMKELKNRINKLFSNLKNNQIVEVVVDVPSVQIKVDDLMKKLNGARNQTKITESLTENIVCPLIESINKPLTPKTRKLLTGNVVEELTKLVEIVISTTCPKKWVLVDLETGEQYSSLGKNPLTKHQSFVKPIRRVVIPKPSKNK